MTLDSESRQLLLESARDWFSTDWPVSRFRALRDEHGRVDGDDVWRGMIELGWSGLLVSEENGGSGLGFEDMGVVLEQSGRTLAYSPLLSTSVIGADALARGRSSVFAQNRLRAIAAGTCRVALAVDESAHHRPDIIRTVATRTDGGWCLQGHKVMVADAPGADLLLVSARANDDQRTLLFALDAASVRVEPLSVIDSGNFGAVTFDGTEVTVDRLLAEGAAAGRLLTRILDIARIGLAAEMLGLSSAAFEMTVDYLKIREQFGQIIGSFQALQHRAAKMYVELEVLRSVVEAALTAASADHPDLCAIASKAKALAGDVAELVTNEAVQLHGGIGMTDEHDAGLFLKRARVATFLYGNASFHRNRFAALRGF